MKLEFEVDQDYGKCNFYRVTRKSGRNKIRDTHFGGTHLKL